MAGKIRYLYETFFDSRCEPIQELPDIDDVVEAFNYREIQVKQNMPSADSVLWSINDQDEDFFFSSPELSRSSSISSLRTVYSLEEESAAVPLFRHSVLIHDVELSPISDKSQETAENELTIPVLGSGGKRMPTDRSSPPKRNQLFPERNNSLLHQWDSGISVSTQSQSLDPIPVQCLALSLHNSQDNVRPGEEESLPFLMPKLNRAKRPRDLVGVRPSLSLSFDTTTTTTTTTTNKTEQIAKLADEDEPIGHQSWYHGRITRKEAELRLKPTPDGTFLVRDSQTRHQHYFLAVRKEDGFVHIEIVRKADNSYELATLTDKKFQSVAAIVNYCAKIGLYSENHSPILLKYPLLEHSL